jgi:hypothetical protein
MRHRQQHSFRSKHTLNHCEIKINDSVVKKQFVNLIHLPDNSVPKTPPVMPHVGRVYKPILLLGNE